MEEPRSRWQYVRDLRPVLLVAIGVVVVGTVMGAVTDKVHRVAAERLQADDVKAIPGANQTQNVVIDDWNVQFSAPLAPEMPLMRMRCSHQTAWVFRAPISPRPALNALLRGVVWERCSGIRRGHLVLPLRRRRAQTWWVRLALTNMSINSRTTPAWTIRRAWIW